MSRKRKYAVHLTEEERSSLRRSLTQGQAEASTLLRAQAFLLADQGKTEQGIREVLPISRGALAQWRKGLAEGGLEGTLHYRPQPGAVTKLDAKGEAVLMALACNDPPDGGEHWTMRLSADRLVGLGMV